MMPKYDLTSHHSCLRIEYRCKSQNSGRTIQVLLKLSPFISMAEVKFLAPVAYNEEVDLFGDLSYWL